MTLELNTNYTHSRSGSLLRIVSLESKILDINGKQVECLNVCEILEFGHCFYCPISDILEYKDEHSKN